MLQYYLFLENIFIVSLIASGFIILLFFPLLSSTQQFFSESLRGLMIGFIITGTGMLIMKQNSEVPKAPEGQHTFMGEVIDIPSEKENSYKTVLKLKGYFNDSLWIHSNKKILVYFEKDDSIKKMHPGTFLLFRGYLNPIRNLGNPGEFDYKKYLSVHRVYHQTYIQKDQWKTRNNQSTGSLTASSNKFRLNLIKQLKKTELDQENRSVATALLLGYKENLSEKTREKFSSSGAMHILAVSGLHVGIVFMLFNYLLFFLNKIKYGKLVKIILLLIILWGYAFLTGLSPSVTRATLMFSVIAVGSQLRRKSPVYNSLAFSAFILLCLNPLLLFSVSFQLSYTAVLSIVFFQPKLYRLISLPYLPDKLWQWFTVAIAAQIGTAPIVIHYFNQFPNYFWLTNFIAIPAAALTIISGFFTLLIYPLSQSLGKIPGSFLNEILTALNYSLGFIENLPGSVTENLWIGKIHMALIYAALIVFGFFIVFRKKEYFKYVLYMIIIWLTFDIVHKYSQRDKKELIIYNTPKTSTINFINGKHNYVFTNGSGTKETTEYYTKKYWLKRRTDPAKYITLGSETKNKPLNNSFFIKDHFIQCSNKKILLLSDSSCLRNKNPGKKIYIDYLLITNNCNVSMQTIMKAFSCRKIILDGNLNYYNHQKWTELLRKNNLEFHSISEQGAFIKKLQ
jgi:competence protein ComEC